MFHAIPRSIWILAIIAIMSINQIRADCSLCKKIEEERAKDQAEHPHPIKYFDNHTSIPLSHNSLPSGPKDSSLPNRDKIDPPIKEVALSNSTESPFDHFFEEDDTLDAHTVPSNTMQSSFQDKIKSDLNSHFYSALNTIFYTKGFLETLDESFTLLLPTNEALQQLQPGILESLFLPENEQKLALLVSNHVVAIKILKSDFEKFNNKEIKAISGRNLTFRSKDGKFSVENANVLQIKPAGNDGVIYIIDKVLLN